MKKQENMTHIKEKKKSTNWGWPNQSKGAPKSTQYRETTWTSLPRRQPQTEISRTPAGLTALSRSEPSGHSAMQKKEEDNSLAALKQP